MAGAVVGRRLLTTARVFLFAVRLIQLTQAREEAAM